MGAKRAALLPENVVKLVFPLYDSIFIELYSISKFPSLMMLCLVPLSLTYSLLTS